MLVKTALVIPVHNRRQTTLRALRSLRRIRTEGLEVKIFIVDDGSTDGTSEAIAQEFPEVEVLQGDGTLHYAAGTNRGIERAIAWDAAYVVTMNDDSVFHEDFLVRLVDTAKNSDRSIVGAMLLLWDMPHLVFQVDPKWKAARGGWIFPHHRSVVSVAKVPFEVDCIVGNCVLFPAHAIRENGLMNELNFPNGWGDVQYTTMMKKAGWRLLIDPRSRVWCEPNTYPAALHTVTLKERLSILFLDQRHPANLKRQLTALWHSAPSKPGALLAFAFYLSSLVLKALKLKPYSDRVSDQHRQNSDPLDFIDRAAGSRIEQYTQ